MIERSKGLADTPKGANNRLPTKNKCANSLYIRDKQCKKNSNPIQISLYEVSLRLRDGGYFCVKLTKIRDENLRLIEENYDLNSKLTKLKEIENENTLLKDQLSIYKPTKSQKLVMANIIGLPESNENSEVLINKGSKDGIKASDTAIFKGYLVGSVVDVFDNRSVVVFITSPKLSVAVLDQSTQGRAKGLVTGDYGTSLIMDRILLDEEIKPDDTIITSGEDGVFEEGFLVGKVVEVSNSASEPLKKAKLETLINLNKLEKGFIVTNTHVSY